jgi:hypothetical protein
MGYKNLGLGQGGHRPPRMAVTGAPVPPGGIDLNQPLDLSTINAIVKR